MTYFFRLQRVRPNCLELQISTKREGTAVWLNMAIPEGGYPYRVAKSSKTTQHWNHVESQMINPPAMTYARSGQDYYTLYIAVISHSHSCIDNVGEYILCFPAMFRLMPLLVHSRLPQIWVDFALLAFILWCIRDIIKYICLIDAIIIILEW